MLRWRHKAQYRHKRKIFWSKLFLFSFVGHVFVLFFVLFVYKGHSFSYDVTVRTELLQGAPVVFVPLHKVINKKTMEVVTKKIEKPAIKQTAIIKKVVSPKQLEIKKTTIASTKKAPVQKKIEPIKKEPAKQVAQVKKVVSQPSQNVVKKTNVSPKSDQSKIAAISSCTKQPVAVTKEVEPIYVGRLEMEALRLQKEMQNEVSKSWKPPVGLSKELECVLKVLVNWNGSVQDTEVEKSSGVLMYDISARTAVAKMQLPRWAYGKEFHITFKQ